MPQIHRPVPTLDDSLKVQRVILAAMLLGIASLLFISLVVIRSGKTIFPQPWRLALPVDAVALGFAAFAAVFSFVIPPLLESSMLKVLARGGASAAWDLAGDKAEAETAALLMIDQSRFITGIALIESAAFFNAIAYMLGGRAFPLIAVAFLVLLLASRFPSRLVLEERIDRGRRTLQEAAGNG